ncbi:site-2 protease family protein [Helicobacter cappadocius]|uniref:Site-2 protease family protein n=1 Tax=Helicobacter cappadocius TaxID=3063998 RepID=A0AA90Q3V4_9HELI|nr:MULTISPECIES: site-2 protease family protein [unclassified Helicobacter]MDO7253740.1 site-2 protease family protein [Helicobacter sp. faydin-H75]MDP2539668.1 site-2 protease family protein [Helicobacter sp. faydin-H76]
MDLDIFSSENVIKTLIMMIAFLIAIIGHEIMHGYVAFRYGDDTAKSMGRLSINPIKHIDLVGSIIVPAVLFFAQAPFLFGWAKPVPVNMSYIIQRWGYGAGIAVSLAGVAYNLILALIASTLLFSNLIPVSGFFGAILVSFLIKLIIYNVVLGIFNLFPIPPLDGSAALSFICLRLGIQSVPRFLNQIAPYGFIIIMLLFFTPLSEIFFYPMNFLLQFLLR